MSTSSSGKARPNQRKVPVPEEPTSDMTAHSGGANGEAAAAIAIPPVATRPTENRLSRFAARRTVDEPRLDISRAMLDTGHADRSVRALRTQARSSVEEHYLDTVGVGGSIPPVPTLLHAEAFASGGLSLPRCPRVEGFRRRVPIG